LRNRTDIISKVDECCCEIQNKISNSTCSIKESISAAEAARLRDELAIANTRNLLRESHHH